MNAVIEVLYLRRPRLEYISPPVCEFDFSSSGGPVIVLDALGRILAPSGFVLGGRGRFQLSWNNYPGALCYTVYKAIDSSNPFGEYTVVAECIEDPSIDLEPEGPGCYRVSAITENGESELSDPICGVGDCPFIISGATPSSQTLNAGDTITISSEVGNPDSVDSYRWFKDGALISDTTATTQEVYQKTSAAQSDSGSYTLVVNNEVCSDESAPATVTVNAGPPCVTSIELVGFLSAIDIGSDGTLMGTNDAGTRPFYHRGGVSKDIRTEVSSAPITASQSGTTITSNADFFSASDVGKVIVFATSQSAQITAFISTTQVTVTPSQAVPSTTFVIRGNTLGGALGQGILANGSGILGGVEEAFGSAGFKAFWLNLNTNTIRNLGADRTPVDIMEDGFMLIRDLTNPADSKALLYDPVAQSFTDLGDIAGGQSAPKKMNEAHTQVALNCTTGGQDHACRWFGGIITDIHPAVAGAQASDAAGINAAGNIFGTYIHPISFDTRTFFNSGGASVDIGTISGEVVGLAINDDSTIVGFVETAGFVFRAFFRLSSGGGIQLIPQLSGTTDGQATAINSDGWIVGDMDSNAFIYRNGATEALFDLIPGGTLWTALFTADFMNDAGQISGLGLYDGNFSRYLLQLCS